MRSISCSEQFSRDVERKPNDQEEAHVSGAYIRSLVKRLSYSRSRGPAKMELEDGKDINLLNKSQSGSPKSLPLKKQVRRRLHTTRPYQERLFNMAEARREIVAALKLHRASMKQANELQSMATASTLQGTSHELVVDSIRNSIDHHSDHNLTNYFHPSQFSPIDFSSPFSWTYPSIAPTESIFDQLNFQLPDQPLGLNLNLQSFQNIDTSIYHDIHEQNPVEPSSSSTSSSSQVLLSSYSNSTSNAMSGIQGPASSQQPSQVAFDPSSVSLHQAMDDEEMAEIQSIGEQHDIEWNDKMNLATSAWWSKFLKNMESGVGEGHGGANGDWIYAFDEALDMPYWLNGSVGENAKENSLFQQHLDDYFHVDDYLQDATLESLDTGEVEYGGE
ncbi:hypothetical protein ZIOFF_000028 [Zingiber officinale]|uniref:Uncharacterized protein n=1 Tax=Zingiber officinale TaxID=94328 RepID=A0A8J5I438_ZINOF|nr:hypothetical protein ZIOFF_000028 [Zingiber officinale]